MSMLRRFSTYNPDSAQNTRIAVSVVIPVFNEENTVQALYTHTMMVLKEHYRSSEIIFVDDGSTDKSFFIMNEIACHDPGVKVIKFERNYGQTAATMAGIDAAAGEIIVTMDGDFQNVPEDIPVLTQELDKGFDLVCGWRNERKDSLLLRTIPSYFANWLVSWIFGQRLHDYGCTFKAMRSKNIKSLILYGEMHRFIPGIIAYEGGRVSEIKIKHNVRTAGESKYGMKRVFKVLFDLFLLVFMMHYSTRPLHFFGYFSVASIGLGCIVGCFTLLNCRGLTCSRWFY
jgi:glycosyltransferase involved in cell wall biosynthesis